MKAAVFAVMACTAFAGPTALAAQASDTDRAQIAALEHRWLDAAHGDRRALTDILAPDFIDIDVNGEVRTRADHLARAATPAATTETITQLDVRTFGDTAIATGINTVHSKTQGWTVNVAFTDVFVRRHGQWRAVSAQETLQKPAAR